MALLSLLGKDDFTLFMEPHLEAAAGEEASKTVAVLVRGGRALEDAVLDTIESLSARKTAKLRGLVAQFHDYQRWLEYERSGWRLSGRPFRERPGTRIYIRLENDSESATKHMPFAQQHKAALDALEAVAAAVGARVVRFLDYGPDMRGIYYRVEKTW